MARRCTAAIAVGLVALTAAVTIPAGSAAAAGGVLIPGAPTQAQAALDHVIATGYGPDVVYSRPYATAFGTLAAVLDGRNGHVDILSFDATSWSRRNTVDPGQGPLPAIGVIGPDSPHEPLIQYATLTAPDTADFAVALPGATHNDLAIVEVSSGGARVVPFVESGSSSNYAETGVLQGSYVVSGANGCVPNCAEGAYIYTSWRYNPPTGAFVPVAAPASNPPAREGAAMAYDAATKQVVLYGGLGSPTSGNPFLSDTWVWDGFAWHRAASSGPGGEGEHPHLAYDETTRQLVLVSSPSEGSQPPSFFGTSMWTGSGWSDTKPAQNLPASTSGSFASVDGLVFQPSTGELIALLNVSDIKSSTTTTQSWSWDGTTWKQLHPATDPPASAAPLAYDATTGLVIREGLGSLQPSAPNFPANPPRAGTWAWDGSNWSELHPVHHPPAPLGASLAYDQGGHDLVMYGGSTGANGNVCGTSTDRWVWDGQDWARADPPTGITGRSEAAMAFDAASGQLLLFGGCTNTATPPGYQEEVLQDTHVLRAGQPTSSSGSGSSSDNEPTDCGFGVSPAFEPDWLTNANHALARHASDDFNIPVASISISAAYYLNLAPAFEPGSVNLCGVNVAGQLINGEQADGTLLPGLANPWQGDQMQIDVHNHGSVDSYVYSADATAWTSFPNPPSSNVSFETSFEPTPEVLPGADLDLTSVPLDASLTLFEIKFASVQIKWVLVQNDQEVLTAELGPSLLFKAEISKTNLLKELADDLETAGSESAAVDEVSTQIANDEAAAVAADGEGFYGLTTSQIEAKLEQSMSTELRDAFTTWLNNLGPGPDADFLESQGVTADEVSAEAAATLEAEATGAAAGGDAIIGKVLCDALFGGPEDVIGDAICLA